MATVDESVFAKTPLGSDLAAGVDSLSLNQEITFTLYRRLVLPLDGYVFWVKADLLGPSAIYNRMVLGRAAYGQAPRTRVAAKTLVVKGSLHYSTDSRQEQEEVYSASRVVFTAEQKIQELAEVEPGTLWIGEFDGRRFAFSSLGSFYKQADLFHYVGMAVYADMETQIIDSPVGFDAQRVVVSNSLPAWLALNGYESPRGFGALPPLFPSFLIPQNERPPFAAVHIPPETTQVMASAPLLRRDGSHSQLCTDTVRITLWGQRNFNAMDFIDSVYEYMELFPAMGTMNLPTVRDEHRTQNELSTIAMKKTIEWQVSYQQSQVRDLAIRYILACAPAFYVDGVRT